LLQKLDSLLFSSGIELAHSLVGKDGVGRKIESSSATEPTGELRRRHQGGAVAEGQTNTLLRVKGLFNRFLTGQKV